MNEIFISVQSKSGRVKKNPRVRLNANRRKGKRTLSESGGMNDENLKEREGSVNGKV